MTTSYCILAPDDPVHRSYHESEYGFPVRGENELFERLVLEINQAGLSWAIVLKKRAAFVKAFDGFDIDTVAAYTPEDVDRLMGDRGIIRNRRKIEAAIENARRLVSLRALHGGFHGWLEAHHPLDHAAWTRLFRKTFVFTGPLVVEEFLMSTGWLPGAHSDDCPVQARIVEARPAWLDRHDKTALDG